MTHTSATETMAQAQEDWNNSHPMGVELLACAASHRHIAHHLCYKPTNDNPETELFATRMTELVEFQHRRWADLITQAAHIIDKQEDTK